MKSLKLGESLNEMIDIELPFPPSGNHFWKHSGSSHYITAKGEKYLRQIQWIIASKGMRYKLSKRLEVEVIFFPPNKRRFDLDNMIKVLNDCLTKSGVWEDDSLIDMLHLIRGPKIVGGKVRVKIAEAGEIFS